MAERYMGPWVLTGLGGKVLKRSMHLDNIRPVAREVLAEGWPVFVRKTTMPQHVIECRLTPENTVEYVPSDDAPEGFVEWVTTTLSL